MRVVGQFLCRERASEAEHCLASEGLGALRWWLEEGGLMDDGQVGFIDGEAYPDEIPPGRQPLRIIVETEAARTREVSDALDRCGACHLQVQ